MADAAVAGELQAFRIQYQQSQEDLGTLRSELSRARTELAESLARPMSVGSGGGSDAGSGSRWGRAAASSENRALRSQLSEEMRTAHALRQELPGLQGADGCAGCG